MKKINFNPLDTQELYEIIDRILAECDDELDDDDRFNLLWAKKYPESIRGMHQLITTFNKINPKAKAIKK